MINIPSFSYQYVKERGIHRPKIPIILSAGNFKTEIVGLIDSGSDYILFPKAIADAVGIKLSKKTEKADGIGGQVNCKSGVATIILKKGNLTKKLTNIRIHVLIDDVGIDEVLLGRIPFFKYFTIEFKENSKRIRLIPIRRPISDH